VDQSNTAAADAAAANDATSVQKSEGSGSQTATNTQVAPIAVAPAGAPQVVPVNANVPVSVLSDGPSGDVSQTNGAYAGADASNTAASRQEAPKDAKKGEGGSQTASNTQILPIAAAPAISGQILPINANVPVDLFTLGGGDDGKADAGTSQSNVAYAGALATNTAASRQYGGGTQTARNTQFIPIAFAPAIAPQILPINANVPITVGNPLAVLPLPVDPFAVLGDPVGTATGLLPLGAVTGLLPALPVPLPALPV
jgi:hypothetical protein